MLARTGLLLTLAVASFGCGGSRVPVYTAEAAAVSYDDARTDWLRHAEHYEDFISRLHVDAVWLSPAFVSAWSNEVARREGLAPGEADRRQASAVELARTEATFIVGITSEDPAWRSLSAPSQMRVVLVEGGAEHVPTRVVHLSRDEAQGVRKYHPKIHPLAEIYRISFSLPESRASVALRIGGPPGFVELKWRTR